METFDITPEALTQLWRLDAIFCRLLVQPFLSLPGTSPDDVHGLNQIVKKMRRLPESESGDDYALVVHPSADPRKPFYRLQFGPRVIDICSAQVSPDPDERDGWVAIRAFGAILGLGAGCRTPRLVKELAMWIDDFDDECRRTSVLWRVQRGSGHVGFMPYPSHLDEDD